MYYRKFTWHNLLLNELHDEKKKTNDFQRLMVLLNEKYDEHEAVTCCYFMNYL